MFGSEIFLFLKGSVSGGALVGIVSSCCFRILISLDTGFHDDEKPLLTLRATEVASFSATALFSCASGACSFMLALLPLLTLLNNGRLGGETDFDSCLWER